MKNKDLIIKIARRLDKFNLDELITISELSEEEVKTVLSELLKKKIIIQNGNNYFFNNQKDVKTQIDNELKPEVKPIAIEEEDGYDIFLSLNEEVQKRIRSYVEILNITNQAGKNNLKSVIEFYNQTSEYKPVIYSTFTKIRSKYEKYGFKGILPSYHSFSESSLPEEVYNYFKKYYLTKEKLSATEAIYRAQKQLQSEQKMQQPYAFSTTLFLKKIRTEFTNEQIEYFRNNINKPRFNVMLLPDGVREPLNMPFTRAAELYLASLKYENKLERLMHDNTNYKNHLEEYFRNLTIKEITNKVIGQYKQSKFDNGYQLASVNTFVNLLQRIIRYICPETNNLAIRKEKNPKNAYALDMNLMTDEQIKQFLKLGKEKYPLVYPIIYISLSTGASIPELLGLTWDRVDFKNQIIFLKYFMYGNRLVINKSNSTMRRLKIDNKICNLLKKKYEETNQSDNDFVFKFNTKKPAQQYIEDNALRKLAKAINIPKLFPSDLQHNFVNICLRQNIPITYIQKSIGYYGITTFVKVYRNLIENLEDGYYNPLQKII